MGVKAAVFQSGGMASSHLIPGAYSRIDFKKSAGGLSSINNAVIAGDCRGGQPNELLWFSSPSEAEATLRDGPLLNAIKHAFQPGPDYTPQRIAALRVNPGLQANRTLAKVSAGLAEKVRLIITHAATASSDVTIVLNGAAGVTIAIASGDTPSQIATKIAAGTFPGYSAVASTDTVTFTATAVGKNSGENTFSGGTTGVTGTIARTVVGIDAATYSPMDVDAWDWGLHGNQVKLKLADGTNQGKMLTVQFMSETAYVADDVYKASILIQYTGSEASCVLSITDSNLFTITPAHTQEITVDFASFKTVQDVVNYINDQPGYSATLSALVPTDPSDELDWVTALDIKSSAVTLQSTVQALIDALNACPWCMGAQYDVTQVGRVLPDNITTWSYFTGGTDGAYTSSEWATSLEYLETQDIQFIGSSSTDAAIHALIRTHVEKMNSVTGKSERQAILGGASGETIAQVIARAQAINSAAVCLAYPEFQDWNADESEVIWWAPAYYACKLVGLATCLAINEPLTNKQLSVLGLKSIKTTDLEKLIQGGVCAAYKNPLGQFVNLRQITTFQGDLLQKNEFSMMREALFINRDLRNTLEQSFIGRAMTNSLLTDVDATVNLKLAQYAALGLFNGDPMYWGYLRKVNGDQIIVEFNCYLTPPTNFIFITSHMAVYASTAA